jgi:hypothetical protein
MRRLGYLDMDAGWAVRIVTRDVPYGVRVLERLGQRMDGTCDTGSDLVVSTFIVRYRIGVRNLISWYLSSSFLYLVTDVADPPIWVLKHYMLTKR